MTSRCPVALEEQEENHLLRQNLGAMYLYCSTSIQASPQMQALTLEVLKILVPASPVLTPQISMIQALGWLTLTRLDLVRPALVWLAEFPAEADQEDRRQRHFASHRCCLVCHYWTMRNCLL